MRIAHILGNLDVGGAELLVLRLIQCQMRQGHSCSVHTLFGTGTLEPQFRETGVELLPHYEPAPLGRMLALRAEFRRKSLDVVHCHNVAPTLLGAPAARMAGVGCVVTTWHSGSWTGKPGHELKYALAGRFCSRVVAVSHAAREVLAAARLADARRIVTVYNGTDRIDVSDVAPAEPRGTFTVVQVGRLAEPKDPSGLLRAFRAVVDQCAGARLWIVGDGPLLEPTRQHARELGLGGAIVFWGRQLDVRPYLAGADVFALCSKSEGVPMALLEAMSVGLPAVVSDVGGMPETLARGAGVVAPCGDAAAFAEGLLRFGLDPELRRRAAPLARERFESQFTTERMARSYEDLYEAGRGA